LNDKNKKIFKKKINNVKNYFFKNSENLTLKEETKNIVEIVLPEKINVEDINVIDLKNTKISNSIFNILSNKYVILSIILAINYYKRKLINKSSINSNKKLDIIDIFNNDILKEKSVDDQNYDANKKENMNKDNNEEIENTYINDHNNIINEEDDNESTNSDNINDYFK
jgi:hypothetical protein